MATPYTTIYERALAKIQDFELAAMPELDLEDTLHGWLLSAISKFRQCKNDLSDRNEELKAFNADLEDTEIEILSILIVREWLSPRLNSVLTVSQFFSDSDQKFYSQAAHLSELQALDNRLKIEAQKLSRDYSYVSDVRGYFDS